VTTATAASSTSRLIKSTHSSGAERPRTPPWSIRSISPVLLPLKFDGVDRPGRWGGSTGRWGGSTRGGSTVNRPLRPIPVSTAAFLASHYRHDTTRILVHGDLFCTTSLVVSIVSNDTSNVSMCVKDCLCQIVSHHNCVSSFLYSWRVCTERKMPI